VVKNTGRIVVLLLLGLVLWMGLDLWIRGAATFYPGYLFDAPRDLGRAGGIGPLLANTVLIVLLAVALATVVSLPAAVVYTELSGPVWWRRLLDTLLDAGVGVPRIVWGLFGGVVFGGILGYGFSVAAGVATLACLLAPILATGFIAGLEAVDPALREQCAALGVSRFTTAWTQVVPAARPALVAALALAVGRGFGDAAALFFTAGLATEVPSSFYDSASTLAVFVFNLLSTVPGGQQAAYAAAAVLFALTLFVQLAIASVGRREGLGR
jgi:phosphate transport system permease protein